MKYKKEFWTNREDEALKAGVSKYGLRNWAKIADMLRNTGKSAQQCQTRWDEYLSPHISKSEWKTTEDNRLMELFQRHGSKWRTIATQLPGRTPSQCQKRYGELLEQAVEGGGGGNQNQNQTSTTTQFNQTDTRAEVQATRLDTMDSSAQEQMLDDIVRGRLANTLGRKSMNKQRKRQLLAAKERAAVQHHREMRAAAAANKVEVEGEMDQNNNMDNEDFIPVTASEVDGQNRRRKQNKEKEDDSSTTTAVTAPPKSVLAMLKNQKSDSTTANQNVSSASSKIKSTFSLSSSADAKSSSSSSNLITPKALQQKRMESLRVQQKLKQQQQQAAAAAQKANNDQTSTSTTSITGVSSSIAAAIKDGGRTRRQREALLNLGASVSFPQWLREETGLNLPLPNTHHSNKTNHNTSTSDTQQVAENLILQQVQRLVESDRALLLQQQQHSSSSDNNNINTNNSVFNINALLINDSSSTTTTTKKNKESVLNSLSSSWSGDCANDDVINAAKMIDQEMLSSSSQQQQQNQKSETNFNNNMDSSESSKIASLITQNILQTEEWKSANKILSSSSYCPPVEHLQRMTENLARSQDDAKKSQQQALLAENVRNWEEELLSSAYSKSIHELKVVKEENDAVCSKLLNRD